MKLRTSILLVALTAALLPAAQLPATAVVAARTGFLARPGGEASSRPKPQLPKKTGAAAYQPPPVYY